MAGVARSRLNQVLSMLGSLAVEWKISDGLVGGRTKIGVDPSDPASQSSLTLTLRRRSKSDSWPGVAASRSCRSRGPDDRPLEVVVRWVLFTVDRIDAASCRPDREIPESLSPVVWAAHSSGDCRAGFWFRRLLDPLWVELPTSPWRKQEIAEKSQKCRVQAPNCVK